MKMRQARKPTALTRLGKTLILHRRAFLSLTDYIGNGGTDVEAIIARARRVVVLDEKLRVKRHRFGDPGYFDPIAMGM